MPGGVCPRTAWGHPFVVTLAGVAMLCVSKSNLPQIAYFESDL